MKIYKYIYIYIYIYEMNEDGLWAAAAERSLGDVPTA